MSQEYNGFTIPAYTDTADAVAMFQNYTDDVTTKLANKITGETGSTEPTGKGAGYLWGDTNAKVMKVYTGSAWLSMGKILQVVAGTYSTAGSTTSSAYVETGLTASITPSSTSNKVLVIASMPVGMGDVGTGGGYARVILYRGNAAMATPSTGSGFYIEGVSADRNMHTYYSQTHLDAPATASAVTYTVRVAADGATAYWCAGNSGASIVLLEVAA